MTGLLCRFWPLLAALLLFAPSVYGAERDVCSTCTYTTIASALSAARSGDTIRVAAGTCNEPIGFSSNMILTPEGGWNSTFTSRKRCGTLWLG